MSDAPHNLLHRLSKEKPVAIDLLRLLFCVAPEPFPRWVLLDHSESLPAALAEAMGDAESSREILDMLERCSLLRLENPDSLALAPHAADEMGGSLEDSQRRRWCETALGLLYAAFPGDSDDVRTWSVCEQLLPHVLAVLDHVDALGLSDRQATWLLDRAATYLCGKGQYQRAQELIERAIAGARLGTDDPLAGTVRLTSGLLRYALGDFSDARRELERALDLHESARDPEHSDIVKDLVALGSVLWELGETQLAQERLERAVAVGDDAGPATDLSACSARRVLGWILLREGDASGARTLHEHALTLALDLAGADHPEVASARGGLALVLQEQGDLGGAQSELQAAIEIARLVLGPEHPEVAVLRSNLSGVLLGLGDLGQAQRQLELALAAGEAALPANHRGLWIRHSKLASVLRTRGDLQRTREHNERALAVSRRALEWDDPRVATDLGALASTLVALGERSAARECYERARSASAHRYGPEHPDVARYDSLLGQVSRELGDLTGARTHYARALDALKGVRESEAGVAETVRVALAGVLAELADQVSATYTALQQERQAEDLREQTRELLSGMLESVLEKRDIRLLAVAADAWMDAAPDPACAALEGAQSLLSGENDAFRRQIGIGWHRLGRSRRTSGDSEGSVHAFEAALPLLDASPQLQGVTLHDIGDVRRSEGRLPDAAQLYRQAAEHKRRGARTRSLATTLLALGRALASSDDKPGALAAYEERLAILEGLAERDEQALGVTLHDIGDVRRSEGRLPDAARLYRQAAEHKRLAGDNGKASDLATTLLALGEIQFELGDAQGAARTGAETVERLHREDYPEPRQLALALTHTAEWALQCGDPATALPQLEEAERLTGGSSMAGQLKIARLKTLQMSAYETLGKADHARAAREQARSTLSRVFESNAVQEDANALLWACAMCAESGAFDLAQTAIEHARAATKRDDPSDPASIQLAHMLLILGRAYEASEEGRKPEALAAYEERLAILEGLAERDEQALGVTLHDIGDVRRSEGRLPDAARLYRQAAEHKRLAGDNGKASDLATTLLALGETQFEMGEPSAVAEELH